jgi:hypothetical protein
MSELIAVAPTRVIEIGSPVSQRRPDGPRRPANMWSLDSDVSSDDLAEHVAGLHPAIDGLARVFAVDPGASADLVLMILARPFGAWMDVEPDTIRLLASAGCGMLIDAYESSDEGEDDSHPTPN